MKQELNLLKTDTAKIDLATNSVEQEAPKHPNVNNYLNCQNSLPTNSRGDPNEIQTLKEQARQMEIDLLRSRVYNLELNAQQ